MVAAALLVAVVVVLRMTRAVLVWLVWSVASVWVMALVGWLLLAAVAVPSLVVPVVALAVLVRVVVGGWRRRRWCRRR